MTRDNNKRKPEDGGVGQEKNPENDSDVDDDNESASSSDEDDDLVLEGVIVRNPDVSDSEDSSVEEDEEEDEGSEEDTKPAASRGSERSNKEGTINDGDNHKNAAKSSKKNEKTRKKRKREGPETIPVEFTFCDMDEKYFHGLKTLLSSSSPLYGAYSSALADLMIENVSVGTVISTVGDLEEGIVYGFASVLNVTTYQNHECIQSLKKLCISHCPQDRKGELETVLSGKTKRPAGFYIQSRMVNLPLEIVEILHQQLVLDMDWAVKNAEGGEEERKSLNFGAFVRVAPSYRTSGAAFYKYFDDEIFSQHAEFTFEIALPKTFGVEETPYCMVIVLTKTGHRAAMESLQAMVGSGRIAAIGSGAKSIKDGSRKS
jgi:protein BCP1